MDSIHYISPGNKLRCIREKRKLSREALADEMTKFGKGVHFKTIETWEKGGAFGSDVIPALCSVLGCDTEYLFGNSETPYRETADVMEATGLSEKAVDRLRDNRKAHDPKDKVSAQGKQVTKDRVSAVLSAILEHENGIKFISAFYFYAFGCYEWATMEGTNYDTKRHYAESYGLNCKDFRFELFDKSSWIHREFDADGFVKMIQDSQMAHLQELLIKLRDDIQKGQEKDGND